MSVMERGLERQYQGYWTPLIYPVPKLPGAERPPPPAMDVPCSRPKFNAMNVDLGKHRELAAAVYVGCWLAWIICMFLLYELAYSFIRRWRVSECPALTLSRSARSLIYRTTCNYAHICLSHILHQLLFPSLSAPPSLVWRTRQHSRRPCRVLLLGYVRICQLSPCSSLALPCPLPFSSPSPPLLLLVCAVRDTGGRKKTTTRHDPQSTVLTPVLTTTSMPFPGLGRNAPVSGSRTPLSFELCSTIPRWGRTSLSWSKEKGKHHVLTSIKIPRSPARLPLLPATIELFPMT